MTRDVIVVGSGASGDIKVAGVMTRRAAQIALERARGN